MVPPPPLKGLGGIDVPPRNWGPTIDALRSHVDRELDEFKGALLVLEKRTYQQKEDTESLLCKIDRILDRLDELEDTQRPSRVDSEFESKVLAALSKQKSSPPDVEVKAGDRSIRGKWWVVIGLALCVVLFAALWQGPELIGAMRGK